MCRSVRWDKGGAELTHLVCVHGSGTICSLDFVDKEISDVKRTTYVTDKLLNDFFVICVNVVVLF